jgi:gliding motility-associated-like protein
MRYYFILFLFVLSGKMQATHIVGGEIVYECLGNDDYRIILTVYRDCFNGSPQAPFDPTASIGIFDANWALVQDLRIPFGKDDTIAVELSNPCLVAPPNVCVHRSTYSATVKLPFKMGGYHIAYQRCCRNLLIRNIPNPLTVGATYYAFLSESAMQGCNNSPRFNKWPPVAICVNEPIDFDHSASEPDGDSLVYRLCTPLEGATQAIPLPQPPNKGPYREVTWQAPYSLVNMLGGQALTIDSKTGFLTGIPNTLGNFVVGICVDEYRKGKLIATTRRDFQYNVADCGVATAAFFAPEIICNQLSVRFDNQSRRASRYRWSFGAGTAASTAVSPVFTFPDTGRYTIRLIANPGQTCADTFIQQIYLKTSALNASLRQQYNGCNNAGAQLLLFDESKLPATGLQSREWLLTGPGGFTGRSSEANPAFQLVESGSYTARLIVVAADGCRDTVLLNITSPIPPLEQLPDSLRACRGTPVRLFPNARPGFLYEWSPTTGLSSATIANPAASPDATTTYVVTARDAVVGCVRTDSVLVRVFQPDIITATVDPDTIFAGQTAQLEAVLPNGTNFSWTPIPDLDNASIANPMASPIQTTVFTVNAVDKNGCPVKTDVALIVLQRVCDEPVLFFPTGFSPNQDDNNDRLKLEASIPIESVYWTVYNRWGQKMYEAQSLTDEWDGTFNGVAQPSDAYGYYVRVECPGGGVWTKKGNVTLLR